MFLVLFVVCLFIRGYTAIPSYIKACDYHNNFRACAVDVANNNVLPRLIHGDKSLKVPPLDPLHLPKVAVGGGENLKIDFSNINIYGFDTAKVTGIDWNIEKRKVYVGLDINVLSLIGQYNIEGKILILPIVGKGMMNMTVVVSHFDYNFNYDIVTQSGAEYVKMKLNDNMAFTIKKAYFNFENLFNGNKAMGENVNRFLNDNDQEVIQELHGTIINTISPVLRMIADGFLSSIPLAELIKV